LVVGQDEKKVIKTVGEIKLVRRSSVHREFCKSYFFGRVVEEIEKIIVKDLNKTICEISRRGAESTSDVDHCRKEMRINFFIKFWKIITRLIVIFKNRIRKFLVTSGSGAFLVRVRKEVALLQIRKKI